MDWKELKALPVVRTMDAPRPTLDETLRDLLRSRVMMDPDGRMSKRAEWNMNQHLAQHGMRVARDKGDKRQDVSGSAPSLRIEPAYDVGDVVELPDGEATVIGADVSGLEVRYRWGALAVVPFDAPMRVVRRAP